METRSRVRNRVYQRKFDHEEAKARYANGESVMTLARAYGVSDSGMRRVLDPVFGARLQQNSARWMMSGVCADCGKEGVSRKDNRCKDCANAAIATTVRADTLRCSLCFEWKPDDEFPRSKVNPHRRGRHRMCRSCGSAYRRDYRNRHKVPCPGCGQPTSPPDEPGRRTTGGLCHACTVKPTRREKIQMSQEPNFVILTQEEEGLWREHGRAFARDKREALSVVFNGNPPEGLVVVVSTQTWKPGRVVPVQMYDLETG